jgi:hypothetical protein
MSDERGGRIMKVPPISLRDGETAWFIPERCFLRVILIVESRSALRARWVETRVALSLVRDFPKEAADLVRADLDAAVEALGDTPPNLTPSIEGRI